MLGRRTRTSRRYSTPISVPSDLVITTLPTRRSRIRSTNSASGTSGL